MVCGRGAFVLAIELRAGVEAMNRRLRIQIGGCGIEMGFFLCSMFDCT